MKRAQIVFIVVMGAACMATYLTSETLHHDAVATEQGQGPALRQI